MFSVVIPTHNRAKDLNICLQEKQVKKKLPSTWQTSMNNLTNVITGKGKTFPVFFFLLTF